MDDMAAVNVFEREMVPGAVREILSEEGEGPAFFR